eukprot:COSAG01_NODE_46154_length_402_cov_2.933993_1_plen_85_part_01
MPVTHGCLPYVLFSATVLLTRASPRRGAAAATVVNVTPVAASAVEASLRIDVRNACCCGETERCLALRKVHEFGATTHPMPKVYE